MNSKGEVRGIPSFAQAMGSPWKTGYQEKNLLKNKYFQHLRFVDMKRFDWMVIDSVDHLGIGLLRGIGDILKVRKKAA